MIQGLSIGNLSTALPDIRHSRGLYSPPSDSAQETLLRTVPYRESPALSYLGN
jgi:hypothetical protein